MLRLSCLCAEEGGGGLQCCSFSVYREGVLRGLALPPSRMFALSFSFCFRCFFAIRSSPCISLLLRCFLPCACFLFYCRSLPLQPLRSPVPPSPSGLGPYVCVSVSWLFAFALSPLLLAPLLSALRRFRHRVLGIRQYSKVVLGSFGGCGSLGGSRCWVVRFCGLATGFPFLLPPCLSNVPILLPASPCLPSGDSL